MEIREFEMSNDFFVSINENNNYFLADFGIAFDAGQKKICFEHWTEEEGSCFHYITFDEFEKIMESYKRMIEKIDQRKE